MYHEIYQLTGFALLALWALSIYLFAKRCQDREPKD